MSRTGNICINAVLTTAAAAAGFLAMELFVALLFPQPVITAAAPGIFFVRYDEEIGWVNKAGAAGTYQPDPGIPPVIVRINELGFRGVPAAVTKPRGTRRVMVLGDSNTFGYGVEENQRFSDLLAKLLPRNYEVINFGVFGYGTDQEALLFERDGLRYNPDILVLAFSAGDLSDNMSSINGGSSKPFFKVEGGRLTLRNTPVPYTSPFLKASSRPSLIKNFLYNYSHLYRLLLRRIRALNLYMSDSVREMSEKEGMNATLAIINGLNNMCRENGCRLVVLLIAHGEWVAALNHDPGATVGYYPVLKNILAQMGIPVIDTTDDFVRRRDESEPFFFPKDPVHLNAGGNKLTAELLYQGLMGNGMINASSVPGR